MTHKKQEEKLNKLWNEIKLLDLNKEEIAEFNIIGFLYSCSRLNTLQVVARMTKLCLEKNIEITKIVEILE